MVEYELAYHHNTVQNNLMYRLNIWKHWQQYLNDFGKDHVFGIVHRDGVALALTRKCSQLLQECVALDLVVVSDLGNDLELWWSESTEKRVEVLFRLLFRSNLDPVAWENIIMKSYCHQAWSYSRGLLVLSVEVWLEDTLRHDFNVLHISVTCLIDRNESHTVSISSKRCTIFFYVNSSFCSASSCSNVQAHWPMTSISFPVFIETSFFRTSCACFLTFEDPRGRSGRALLVQYSWRE